MFTPILEMPNGCSLQIAQRKHLTELMQAYQEDPESAQAALPWLEPKIDIHRQFRDMLFDIELKFEDDTIHFWVIFSKDNEFIGMVGLGDELQLETSSYNLGYWVRKPFRRQGIAKLAVQRIFEWLESRGNETFVEIAVHPRNEAGISTAESICIEWSGDRISEYFGIEVRGRTVPHHLFVIHLPRGEGD
ncbi:MAG: GNAT family N-acetyltransferase [archaeon]|nr:GNAT family N-acetyltransferase [archaeon]MDA1168062.1 GNAT family N-acetyltransferase [archaeon]